MNSPRPTRNIQQVRSIIQNMGRSIDEARNRRLGPNESDADAPTQGATSATTPASTSYGTASGASGAVATKPATSAVMASTTTVARSAPDARTGAESATPPPVRSAHEMFSGDAPRLKARPKRSA